MPREMATDTGTDMENIIVMTMIEIGIAIVTGIATTTETSFAAGIATILNETTCLPGLPNATVFRPAWNGHWLGEARCLLGFRRSIIVARGVEKARFRL